MNRRAAVDPVTISVIAAVAIVFALSAPSGSRGKKHFWEFWKSDPIADVQKAAAAVDEAKAKADAEVAAAKKAIEDQRNKQLGIGHEASVATGAALAAATAKAATGEIPTRELKTATDINATGTQALDQALGPVAPVRIRELELMVSNLNAGIAAGTKALDLMQGALDRAVQDRAAAEAKLAQTEAAHAARIKEVEAERDAAMKKEQAWAADRDAIAREYERLTFWGKLGAGVAVMVFGYVVFLIIRVRGLTRFGKDVVGMTEMLKGEFKSRVKPEEYEALKERMRADWMTVEDGTAKLVNKFKTELRL